MLVIMKQISQSAQLERAIPITRPMIVPDKDSEARTASAMVGETAFREVRVRGDERWTLRPPSTRTTGRLLCADTALGPGVSERQTRGPDRHPCSGRRRLRRRCEPRHWPTAAPCRGSVFLIVARLYFLCKTTGTLPLMKWGVHTHTNAVIEFSG